MGFLYDVSVAWLIAFSVAAQLASIPVLFWVWWGVSRAGPATQA